MTALAAALVGLATVIVLAAVICGGFAHRHVNETNRRRDDEYPTSKHRKGEME